MSKPYQTLILSVTTLFFLVTLCAAKENHFSVQGQVFCDVCRAGFFTKPCTYIKGATVRLECRNREQDTVLTFKGEATTDDSGTYHISVDGPDFEDDICEVKLVKSPDSDCNEINVKNSNDKARVSLAANSGMTSDVRMANPIGFLKKSANSECSKLLEAMGVVPDT
ncbi:hypothetical protein DCAR_0205858 [Daucus carota subsp. sativus]|uniref:Uncharacterized protein n=1 Tax=Daucus carota subsp. sativus TaxID=79200 RepID=A0A166CVA8_DAUCS|nr:PREDICTED: olee1-like protein [Daucus carota subsp. sativus]XP_017233194.1 PREDICTED: olee1-like protein [Daucus carota subsp. sativus]WOG86641.1 hypothetical protein DCAR_0205858 [Daucus carota subsp. sativus]